MYLDEFFLFFLFRNIQYMRIINIKFLIHGELMNNENVKLYGHANISMNSKGVSQIENKISEIKDKTFDIIYYDLLSRTQECCDILKPHLISDAHLKKNDLFIERNFGIMNGLTKSELKSKHKDLYNLWKNDDSVVFLYGESLSDVCFRIIKGLKFIMSQEENEILWFTHPYLVGELYRFVNNIELTTKLKSLLKYGDTCDLTIVKDNSNVMLKLCMNGKIYFKNVSELFEF